MGRGPSKKPKHWECPGDPRGIRINKLTSIGVLCLPDQPTHVIFKCDCGRVTKVSVNHLRTKTVPWGCKKCCPQGPYDPNFYRTKGLKARLPEEYQVWAELKSEGTLCDRWRKSFRLFVMELGLRPAGMRLRREDPSQLHSPTNSFWGDEYHWRLRVYWNGEIVSAPWLYREFGIPIGFTREMTAKGCRDGREILRLYDLREDLADD